MLSKDIQILVSQVVREKKLPVLRVQDLNSNNTSNELIEKHGFNQVKKFAKFGRLLYRFDRYYLFRALRFRW